VPAIAYCAGYANASVYQRSTDLWRGKQLPDRSSVRKAEQYTGIEPSLTFARLQRRPSLLLSGSYFGPRLDAHMAPFAVSAGAGFLIRRVLRCVRAFAAL